MTPATKLLNCVPIHLIERLIAIGMSKSADFTEVYIERSCSNQLVLEEHKIRNGNYSIRLGVGIRVIKGHEVGYAFSDDLEPAALRATAAVAAAIANGAAATGLITPLGAHSTHPQRYLVGTIPDATPLQHKVDLLMRGNKAAYAVDARVTQVMGACADQTKEILIANSHGLLIDDLQIMCRMHYTAIAEDTHLKERHTGFHGGGGRVGFSHYDTFTPESIATEAARMAVAQMGAVAAPAGAQTVVLSPGWSGVLLHEAVGHGLEADFIHKGTSLYAGKVGQKVASDLCSVIDSGTLPHKRGSINIDDEGHVAEEKILIENGILKSYMVDYLSSCIMGIPSTGSGRRESYQHAPMPRMTNTYLAAGSHTHEEIIASVEKGLYCAAFGGGQVDISNGNFVFEVAEGYLIEHGKITQPVRNATLIGVGPEALQHISMVGNNPMLDPGIGTCGKNGQTVPVGVGMPTVRMDSITVGGTHAG